MGLRLGIAWLHHHLRSGVPDDALEDFDDFLDGKDAEINERAQKQRRDLILAGGGEIA